jgi:hypothetical protein
MLRPIIPKRCEAPLISSKREGRKDIFSCIDRRRGKKASGSNEAQILKVLGIKFEEISSDEKEEWGISVGLRVIFLTDGVIKHSTNMREGFIIIAINDERVRTSTDFFRALQNINEMMMFVGFILNCLVFTTMLLASDGGEAGGSKSLCFFSP